MLYELIGVCRATSPSALHEIKEIVLTAGTQILSTGGVVRGISNWGTSILPKPVSKYQITHRRGHYFVMRFDCSARTQGIVRKTLGLDPRMLKYSVVKLGNGLKDIKDVEGVAKWPVAEIPGLKE